MDIVDYLFFQREAYITALMETDKGREYLDNAWRLTQTEPDRKSIREKFKREER